MRLADFITDHIEDIIDEWEGFARQIPVARELDREQLRDHARQILQTIARDLHTPQTEAEQKRKSEGKGHQQGLRQGKDSGAFNHATDRTRAGFIIEDLIAEYRALRASVLRLWGKASGAEQGTDYDDLMRFNEAVDQAIVVSVGQHASLVRQAQNMFLGILGHDLRDPLGAIAMASRYLVDHGEPGSKSARTAAMIHNSSRQMERLIRDLLDFIRTRLGQDMPVAFEEADLLELGRQAVAQAEAILPGHAVMLEADGDLHGRWDPGRIGQVFSNLLGNAVRHGSADEPVRVILSGDAQEVCMRVHNRGAPIPDEVLPRIFDPLWRADEEGHRTRVDTGLGLGLYIAREVVQAHGGAIEVTSSAEAGTCFTVRLPRRSGAG